MKYKQLTDNLKAQIDILLQTGNSMRQVGKLLGISHSTVSRYKNKKYTKREIDVRTKYAVLISYLEKHYDRKDKSIEVCLHNFQRYHSTEPTVTVQQVYNWINKGLLSIEAKKMCYKRRKKKLKSKGIISQVEYAMNFKTVLPIGLRPKYTEERNEIGHLEIDSIVGKRNESHTIISIVDRCSRQVHLLKAEYTFDYYTSSLITKYLKTNDIEVKSITVDNGFEFKTMGICAKTFGVKLYKCDPYCSFQRGTNEHMNGIVRRFIPKGKSLYNYEQQYLEDISFKINSMPRRMFDFKTPFEVHFFHIRNGAVEI